MECRSSWHREIPWRNKERHCPLSDKRCWYRSPVRWQPYFFCDCPSDYKSICSLRQQTECAVDPSESVWPWWKNYFPGSWWLEVVIFEFHTRLWGRCLFQQQDKSLNWLNLTFVISWWKPANTLIWPTGCILLLTIRESKMMTICCCYELGSRSWGVGLFGSPGKWAFGH